MGEIVRYTATIIQTGDTIVVDPDRLGPCPRCGRPVIAGKRGFGCSGWREGCPFVLWREYKDQVLGDAQIRELLQGRVLSRPVTLAGGGDVLLQLSDAGTLLEIPMPTGGPPRSKTMGRSPGRRRKPAPGRRRDAASGEMMSGDRPREPAADFAQVVLGPCPRCGGAVVEQEKSYGCSGGKQGCKFAIWKTIAGKKIGVRTAQSLLRTSRSPVLKGFRSKAGKPFMARLKIDQGEVRFDFGS